MEKLWENALVILYVCIVVRTTKAKSFELSSSRPAIDPCSSWVLGTVGDVAANVALVERPSGSMGVTFGFPCSSVVTSIVIWRKTAFRDQEEKSKLGP
jgi:hypothetical protein